MNYYTRAMKALGELARSGHAFTADDLVAKVGHPDLDHEANGRNSVIGSLFRQAHRAGLIEPTGDTRQSTQPHRKGGLVRVWRGCAARPEGVR